jgi:hypothetical protein
MRRTAFLASLVILVACRSRSTETAATDAAVAAPSASATPVVASTNNAPIATASAAIATAPATTVLDASVPEHTPSGAHAVASFPGGAVEVWSRGDEAGKSDVLARRLDASGVPTGPTKLVRRTSGAVEAVRAVADHGAVWIVWSSDLGQRSDPGQREVLVAAVRADADLAKVTTPITLSREKLTAEVPEGGEDAFGLVVSERLAGGVLVAARAGRYPVKCLFANHGATNCEGPSYDVFAIDSAGAFTKLARRTIDGGPAVDLLAVVDVGGAAVVSAFAWHGGAEIEDTVMPLPGGVGDAGAPHFAFSPCRPPFDQQWTGDTLVTICPADHWEEKYGRCPASPGEGLCPRVSVLRPDGGVALGGPKPAFIRAIETRCEGGHPVVEIVHAGGRVRLDPSQPGASVPRLHGWTGTALLELDDEGKITRRTCGADGKLSKPVRTEK